MLHLPNVTYMSPFSSKVFLLGGTNINISANMVIFLGVFNHAAQYTELYLTYA